MESFEQPQEDLYPQEKPEEEMKISPEVLLEERVKKYQEFLEADPEHDEGKALIKLVHHELHNFRQIKNLGQLKMDIQEEIAKENKKH